MLQAVEYKVSDRKLRLFACARARQAWDMMPSLHDALVEAGCDNEEILRHCRGWEWCLELWPKYGNPALVGTKSRYGPLTHSDRCLCKGSGIDFDIAMRKLCYSH